MSNHTVHPRILEVMPYEESILKGRQVLLEVVGILAAVISAVVALIRLIWDIRKDREQKSNRPTKD